MGKTCSCLTVSLTIGPSGLLQYTPTGSISPELQAGGLWEAQLLENWLCNLLH